MHLTMIIHTYLRADFYFIYLFTRQTAFRYVYDYCYDQYSMTFNQIYDQTITQFDD